MQHSLRLNFGTFVSHRTQDRRQMTDDRIIEVGMWNAEVGNWQAKWQRLGRRWEQRSGFWIEDLANRISDLKDLSHLIAGTQNPSCEHL